MMKRPGSRLMRRSGMRSALPLAMVPILQRHEAGPLRSANRGVWRWDAPRHSPENPPLLQRRQCWRPQVDASPFHLSFCCCVRCGTLEKEHWRSSRRDTPCCVKRPRWRRARRAQRGKARRGRWSRAMREHRPKL